MRVSWPIWIELGESAGREEDLVLMTRWSGNLMGKEINRLSKLNVPFLSPRNPGITAEGEEYLNLMLS